APVDRCDSQFLGAEHKWEKRSGPGPSDHHMVYWKPRGRVSRAMRRVLRRAACAHANGVRGAIARCIRGLVESAKEISRRTENRIATARPRGVPGGAMRNVSHDPGHECSC